MDDKIFERAMKLQEAKTIEEVKAILRTDPDLTEEDIKEAPKFWNLPDLTEETDDFKQQKSEMSCDELMIHLEEQYADTLIKAVLCDDPQQEDARWDEAYKIDEEMERLQRDMKEKPL